MRGVSIGLLGVGLVLVFASCGDPEPPATAVVAPPTETTAPTTAPTPTETTAVPPPPPVDGLLFIPESFRERLVELVEETGRLRGMSFPEPLPIEAVTSQEMSRRLRARVEENIEQARLDEALYKLLGLLAADRDWPGLLAEFRSRPTPGFYDVSSGKLWLLSTLETPTALEEMTLVGEMAKALVDRNLGVWERRHRLSSSGDGDFLTATGALAEADSVLVELLFWEGMTTERKWQVAREVGALSAEQPSLPSFVRESLRFSSGPAVDYLQGLYQMGGWDLINDVHRNPPDSTEQILLPDTEHPGPVLMDKPGVSPPEGYREVADSVWGQWGWNTLLGSVLDSDPASSASRGWGGDRYLLFTNGEELALVVDYRGDTADDTLQMRMALEEYIPAGMKVGEPRPREAGLEYYDRDYAWLGMGVDGRTLTFIAATDVELGRRLRLYLFG